MDPPINQCSNSCSKECIQIGKEHIYKALGDLTGSGNALFLANVLKTFTCYLPADMIDKIESDISYVLEESSAIVSRVNLLYIVTIYVTLLLLIILIYLNSYFHGYTFWILFLSIIILIISGLILYFGLSYLYGNSTNFVNTIINHDIAILQNARFHTLCCASGNANECANVIANTCPFAPIT